MCHSTEDLFIRYLWIEKSKYRAEFLCSSLSFWSHKTFYQTLPCNWYWFKAFVKKTAKDNPTFSSKLESSLWREIQHGILTETPDGKEDAKVKGLGQGQYLWKIQQWERCGQHTAASHSLCCDAVLAASPWHCCFWVGSEQLPGEQAAHTMQRLNGMFFCLFLATQLFCYIAIHFPAVKAAFVYTLCN